MNGNEDQPSRPDPEDVEYYSAVDGKRALRPRAALPIATHEKCARILAGLIAGLRSAAARETLESVRARLSEWIEFEHPEHTSNPYEDALDEAFAFALPSELELVRQAVEQGYPEGAGRQVVLKGIEDAIAAR